MKSGVKLWKARKKQKTKIEDGEEGRKEGRKKEGRRDAVWQQHSSIDTLFCTLSKRIISGSEVK